MRPSLAAREVSRIRSDRLRPRLTHPHYLHLSALRRGVAHAIVGLPLTSGPVLDLYCGTQPYRDLIPWRPVWGLDIDLHFGRADLVGDVPLPLADERFSLALCTQALYLREDDSRVVAEMNRVVQRGRFAVVSVPYLWRREGFPVEHRYSREDLLRLFAGWSEVSLRAVGTVGTGLAYYLGSYLAGIGRRWPSARPLTVGATVLVNLLGWVIDLAAHPLTDRWPAIWLIVTRRALR